MSTTVKIEQLNGDNYDTWRIQVESLLIKNENLEFVDGTKKKPTVIAGDAASATAEENWIKADKKARADLILTINPSELKQVKGCETSNEVWKKLESIYCSKGPARKATLLKQLILQKLEDDQDINDHLRKFFDAVDKLESMGVKVNEDLLAIMLLYSLSPQYENFRCAIESRDTLPSPQVLRIKIKEEFDARKNETRQEGGHALYAKQYNFKGKGNYMKKHPKGTSEYDDDKENKIFPYNCRFCEKKGHKMTECKELRELLELKRKGKEKHRYGEMNMAGYIETDPDSEESEDSEDSEPEEEIRL